MNKIIMNKISKEDKEEMKDKINKERGKTKAHI